MEYWIIGYISGMNFTKAIVRKPSRSLVKGISSAGIGTPDYELACSQHWAYVEALQECGVKVIVLEPMEDFPDSVFVEDVALCTSSCAIITNPGAESRRGEISGIVDSVTQEFEAVFSVESPGTAEAGDIMMAGNIFYIGLSARTNINGANQIKEILESFGFTAIIVQFENMLHLKSGVSYLENNKLLVCDKVSGLDIFKSYDRLRVPDNEEYASNSLWINGTVLVPSGYPLTSALVSEAGYRVIELDVSEFRKLDGGLSCLSLRF